MVADRGHPELLFKEFLQAEGFPDVIAAYHRLCDALDISAQDHDTFYDKLKDNVKTNEAVSLWKLLDSKAQQKVYEGGNICKKQKVFVVGAGPCGLRMAIEARLLGSQVVVVEMRNYVTRNNVLHLWPSVIHDLKTIGAKIFFRRFCIGSIDHISIRRLQSILLKVALMLGVRVHAPVKFVGLNEPTEREKGWTANLEPADSPASKYEFDFIVGAEGKKISLQGFRKRCFRAKQALAITYNLINENRREDTQVEEMGGWTFQSNQNFFKKLRDQAGVELENIVYFRDETHYFVMTTKKLNLLSRGVLKEDKRDTQSLLSWDNINREELLRYARDVTEISTDGKMPKRPFALNHKNQEDVAIFDFTAVYQCEYSTLIRERFGRTLTMTIVGDGLVEPFWPTGSGAGRGFLGVMDAAWLLRICGEGKSPLECLAEKERLFQLMANVNPGLLRKQLNEHSIDPATRYVVKNRLLTPKEVEHLFIRHGQTVETVPHNQPSKTKPQAVKRPQRTDSTSLLTWYQDKLKQFTDIPIENLDTSWKDGRALCALASLCRPKLIDMKSITKADAKHNIQLAFDVFYKEFGLETLATPEDVINESGDRVINQLTLISYLGLLQERLQKETKSQTQDDSSEPPAKKLQPSVVLEEFSTKEPELMGVDVIMGMDVVKYMSSAGSKDKSTTGAKTIADAKFGEMHPETDAELEACSGLALRRIQEAEKIVHGKFFQQMNLSEKKKETKPLEGPSSEELTEARSSKVRSTMMSNSSERCAKCGKRVYHVERVHANGFIIHKGCLRCSVCDCTLRQGNSHARQIPGEQLAKFYCFRHAYDAGLLTVPSRNETSGHLGEPSEHPSEPVQGNTTDATNAGEDPSESSSSADEEECQEDNAEAASEPNLLRRRKQERSEPEYRDSTSMKLILSQQIQDELEDVDDEEKELQERGKQIEETIRKQAPDSPVDDPELVTEWMDVMKKKQELKEKEAKLVLQMKVLQLQERQKQLLKDLKQQMEQLRGSAEMEAALEQLDQDTSSLEAQMAAIKEQITNLKIFLEPTSHTEA